MSIIHYIDNYCGTGGEDTSFWYQVTCPHCVKKRMSTYFKEKTMKKTQVETERRFLLKKLPKEKNVKKRHTYDKCYQITQKYLSEIGDNTTTRIRWRMSRWDEEPLKLFYTEKTSISPLSCDEYEKNIDLDEYLKLSNKSLRELNKKRYTYIDGDLTWEIDQFEMGKDYTSLIIAEVEIPNEDYDLKIPKFIKKNIIREITGMKEFSNSKLAKKSKTKVLTD